MATLRTEVSSEVDDMERVASAVGIAITETDWSSEGEAELDDRGIEIASVTIDWADDETG